MAEEITIELKKPLEKMTAKELRDLVINQMPMIQGASGMDKDALVAKIKEVLGITTEAGGAKPFKAQILSMKAQMRELRLKKTAEAGRKEKDVIRRKVNRLKKLSRRLAKAS